MTTGEKRNKLLEMSTGRYVCFIDDDDRIADDYINKVVSAIEADYPDVIGLIGIINICNVNGTMTSRRFYHTIRNHSFWESQRGYERPPNHLNPMKRDIAIRYKFPDKTFGEDTDWASQIMLDRVLKTEYYIDSPIYFYDYFPLKTY